MSETVPVQVEYSGELGGDFPSFVAGCQNGLYLFHHGSMWRLIEGRFYGVTFANVQIDNRWWVVASNENDDTRTTDLVQFELTLEGGAPVVSNTAPLVCGLSAGIHQIDFIGSRLWVTATYENAISLYRENGSFIERLQPAGDNEGDVLRLNYRHYNSVYFDGTNVHLVAHNNSVKSGLPSLVETLGPNGEITECRSLNAYAAHNIVIDEGATIYCDSLSGRVMLNDERELLARPGYITRGVATNGDVICVGASKMAFGAKARRIASGLFCAIDPSGALQGEIELQGIGGIGDVRFLRGDKGLSNSNLSPTVAHALSRMRNDHGAVAAGGKR